MIVRGHAAVRGEHPVVISTDSRACGAGARKRFQRGTSSRTTRPPESRARARASLRAEARSTSARRARDPRATRPEPSARMQPRSVAERRAPWISPSRGRTCVRRGLVKLTALTGMASRDSAKCARTSDGVLTESPILSGPHPLHSRSARLQRRRQSTGSFPRARSSDDLRHAISPSASARWMRMRSWDSLVFRAQVGPEHSLVVPGHFTVSHVRG